MLNNENKTDKKSEKPSVNIGFFMFLIILVASVVLVFALAKGPKKTDNANPTIESEIEQQKQPAENKTIEVKKTEQNDSTPAEKPAEETKKNLPKLIDLGSDHCIPCIKMKPILNELKQNYADKFTTEFIDINKSQENMEIARNFGIRLIPTQIFFDENGEEIGRNTGFLTKEEILKKWLELGYEFN